MKYVFFGTPKFAEIILEKLIEAGYFPEAVVCSPHRILNYKLGIGRKIKILRPNELDSNFKSQILELKPDLAIVAAYGKIIPKEILDIPRFGFLNAHGSILPAYRGASPIQSAILNGDQETGITIMKIDEKIDHGEIVSASKISITEEDTYESLSQKLAISGAELLIKTIPDYLAGKIKPIEQNHAQATYIEIIKKEDGKINWEKSAEAIERMTRAFYPWPSAWTETEIKNQKSKIKIIKADISDAQSNYHIGEVFLDHNGRLAVKCGQGVLIIEKLQLEGGKVLTAKEFLNGHQDFIGVRLG